MSERTLEERVSRLEMLRNDDMFVMSMVNDVLTALMEKVFPEGMPEPKGAKGDRSPEEVEKLLKWGIRMGKLKGKELLYCMSFVAGYLMEDNLLTTEQSAKIQSIVTEALS